MAVFAADETAPKRDVFAFSFASLSLGFIFSAISAARSLATSAPVTVEEMCGCSSCWSSESFSVVLVRPTSVSLPTSAAPCTIASSVRLANLSVSFANSEFAMSSLSFVAPSTTLLKPQDHRLLAAVTPLLILSIGKASWSSFCMPAGSPSSFSVGASALEAAPDPAAEETFFCIGSVDDVASPEVSTLSPSQKSPEPPEADTPVAGEAAPAGSAAAATLAGEPMKTISGMGDVATSAGSAAAGTWAPLSGDEASPALTTAGAAPPTAASPASLSSSWSIATDSTACNSQWSPRA
mmetsp:Transcript_17901/g.49104  ORF Transcript_17901/g.49104 Transcript_17901/m.49104 type:complete len:295 (-) Transcript_17901:66-950(-)